MCLANDPRRDAYRTLLATEGALVKGMAGFRNDGGNGDDLLVGSADSLYGNLGDDVLFGLAGNDQLAGSGGDDLLDGGADADTVYAGSGNDLLVGGTGNDSLYGGLGDDTYQFKKGDGTDSLNEQADLFYGTGGGTADTIRFLDVASMELTALRNGSKLLFQYGSDSVTINGHFGGGEAQIERIEFTGGVSWDVAAIQAHVIVRGSAANDSLSGLAVGDRMYGLEGNDTIHGYDGNDTIDGGDGADELAGDVGDDLVRGGAQNDRLWGWTGNDILQGQDGDDTLNGEAGHDTLDGGAGNDTLTGRSGNDTYLLSRGSGADVLIDNDSTLGNVDLAQFGAGIASDQLWFRHVGNDLEVSVIGGGDKLTVQNWYGVIVKT